MKHLKRLSALGVSTILLFAVQVPGSATTPTPAITIGVDHVDPANQDPGKGRVFEYTDFFTGAASTDSDRTATVKQGDTIDFQTAPFSFHDIAVAPSESAARVGFPLFFPDADDGPNPNGAARVQFGPAFPFRTSCGLVALNQQPCTFDGTTSVTPVTGLVPAGPIAGFNPVTMQPAAVDWLVTIAPNTPTITYDFFCYIHPGMSGKLKVVSDRTLVPNPDAVNQQFLDDQAAGTAAEKAALNSAGFNRATNTFEIRVGTSDANTRVGVLEMIPQQAAIPRGANVHFTWLGFQEPHTVGAPALSKNLPDSFGFDCAQGFVGFSNLMRNPHTMRPPCNEVGERPEVIADPGMAPGVTVRNTQQILDSGVMFGANFGISNPKAWSLTTDKTTDVASYQYHCTIHDFMVGTFTVLSSFGG